MKHTQIRPSWIKVYTTFDYVVVICCMFFILAIALAAWAVEIYHGGVPKILLVIASAVAIVMPTCWFWYDYRKAKKQPLAFIKAIPIIVVIIALVAAVLYAGFITTGLH